MSLLQDLVSGKELSLSNGSKIMLCYKTDENVMTISIGGNEAILTQSDLNLLMQLENLMRMAKNLESKG